MMRSKTEIFDEASRKRGPPEPVDGLDPAKRQKLGAQVVSPAPNRLHIPPLAPGNHTIAELFTITTDEALKGFDVALLSEDLVVKIGITILQRIEADTIEQAIRVSFHNANTKLFTITHMAFRESKQGFSLFQNSNPKKLMLRRLHWV